MKDIYFSFLVFILIFTLYLFTGYPTVSPYRDSGDLAAASYSLGIAHPPGYPLYTLLGKIFYCLIPFASAGYRVNLMSIFFAGLCCAFSFLIVKTACKSIVAGIISVLFLASSPAFYSLAHVSEMYSMSAAFTALIFLLILKANNSRDMYLVFLILALSLGSHPAMSLIIPGVIIFLFLRRNELNFSVRSLAVAVIFFLAGFLIFTYFPVRSCANPVLEWGRTNTFEGFFRLLTRADYGGLKLHPEQSKFHWTLEIFAAQNVLFVKSLVRQFGIPGVIGGFLGIILFFKNRLWWPAFTGLILTGPLFFVLSNLPLKEKTTLPILEPHIVTPNFIFAVFIGIISGYLIQSGIKKLLSSTFIIAIAVTPLFIFAVGFEKQNHRNSYFSYDRAQNIFRTMSKDSLLYDPDDSTAFIVSYFRLAEGKRKDIKPVVFFRTHWGYERLREKHPELFQGKDILTAQEFIREIFSFNIDKRKIYTDIVTKIPGEYKSYPVGVLYIARMPEKKLPREFLGQSELLFNEIYTYRGNYNTSLYEDFFISRMIYYYAAGRNNLGMEYAAEENLKKAKEQYNIAVIMDPYLAEAHNNLGAVYYKEKNFSNSLECFEKAIEIKPEDPMLLYNAGLVSKNTGKLDLAEKYLRDSNKLSYNPGTMNELGLIELSRKNYDKAASVFNEIIIKSPSFPAAHYNLGLAMQKKGDVAGAISAYKRYLGLINDPAEISEVRSLIKQLE